MSANILRSSLTVALALSMVAFVLCMVVAAAPFIGFAHFFATGAIALFLGAFPLFFGSVCLLVRRTKGRMVKDWVPILFRGLPKWFSKLYRCYFFLVWIGGVAAIVLAFRVEPSLAGLLFIFIPSVFYLTCVGAYWSALREMALGEQGAEE